MGDVTDPVVCAVPLVARLARWETKLARPLWRHALYLSGETFFTLGYGDFAPTAALGRFLSVLEAGMGFGFMAVIIGYLPVLYQAFSRRERTIGFLDAQSRLAAQSWRAA